MKAFSSKKYCRPVVFENHVSIESRDYQSVTNVFDAIKYIDGNESEIFRPKSLNRNYILKGRSPAFRSEES